MVVLQIDGVRYFTSSDLIDYLGISRTTLWRWRQDGKIPLGHRYRDGQVLFTEQEVEAVRSYANRVEPIGEDETGQLQLFRGSGKEVVQ